MSCSFFATATDQTLLIAGMLGNLHEVVSQVRKYQLKRVYPYTSQSTLEEKDSFTATTVGTAVNREPQHYVQV